MKKIIVLISFFSFIIVQSCLCPNRGFSITHVTIESVRSLFFSFDEHGIFPYLDDFNRAELGIGISSDSTTERTEVSYLSLPLISSAYACQDNSKTEYENFIDSIHIFTKYDFDTQHLAGSNVNDILKPIDIMGETIVKTPISELSIFVGQPFKFSSIPTGDSMQFIITGRITGKGNFSTQTDLIVLQD